MYVTVKTAASSDAGKGLEALTTIYNNIVNLPLTSWKVDDSDKARALENLREQSNRDIWKPPGYPRTRPGMRKLQKTAARG